LAAQGRCGIPPGCFGFLGSVFRWCQSLRLLLPPANIHQASGLLRLEKKNPDADETNLPLRNALGPSCPTNEFTLRKPAPHRAQVVKLFARLKINFFCMATLSGGLAKSWSVRLSGVF
jgi:hypothetical protein